MPTRSDKTNGDIAALLRARNPLLWIVTREEKRVEHALIDGAPAHRYEPVFWDCAGGLTTAAGEVIDACDHYGILNKIREDKTRRLYILRDYHRHLTDNDPWPARCLRNLARDLPRAPLAEARAIVILSPSADVPPQISAHAIIIDYPLPEREEIGAILETAVDSRRRALSAMIGDETRTEDERTSATGRLATLEASVSNGARDRSIDAAIGLTSIFAEATYAKSLVLTGGIDPDEVAAEKKREIAASTGLEWIDPDPRGMSAVGGVELAKAWIAQRRLGLTRAARAYGLPVPRGVLCLGVSGCGKSMLAKATAADWGIPLLRFDLGAIKDSLVGGSEKKIRAALRTAETVAPCVLLIDEIEKALAGAQGSRDGGVSADQVGALLTWMQDHTAPVFVVATANDISALPPEMLRKGRFDELFFFDLPTRNERAAIVRATVEQYRPARPMEAGPDIDVSAVAAATEHFNGAELAALVPDAMFAAFADGGREFSTLDLLNAARTVTPLAKTAAERVNALRDWASTRCRPASERETGQRHATRQLDIE